MFMNQTYKLLKYVALTVVLYFILKLINRGDSKEVDNLILAVIVSIGISIIMSIKNILTKKSNCGKVDKLEHMTVTDTTPGQTQVPMPSDAYSQIASGSSGSSESSGSTDGSSTDASSMSSSSGSTDGTPNTVVDLTSSDSVSVSTSSGSDSSVDTSLRATATSSMLVDSSSTSSGSSSASSSTSGSSSSSTSPTTTNNAPATTTNQNTTSAGSGGQVNRSNQKCSDTSTKKKLKPAISKAPYLTFTHHSGTAGSDATSDDLTIPSTLYVDPKAYFNNADSSLAKAFVQPPPITETVLTMNTGSSSNELMAVSDTMTLADGMTVVQSESTSDVFTGDSTVTDVSTNTDLNRLPISSWNYNPGYEYLSPRVWHQRRDVLKELNPIKYIDTDGNVVYRIVSEKTPNNTDSVQACSTMDQDYMAVN